MGAKWSWGTRVAVAVLFAGLGLWAAVPAAASTFTVSNLDDSGAGSLRQAVTDANNAGSPALIDFAPGLTGLINLTSGPLAITGDMTIEGPGPGVLEVDGRADQILTVSASSIDTISGLRFAGGAAPADGGAIANSGTLAVSHDTLDHNAAGGPGSSNVGHGGAIYNTGTLIVTDGTFADNTAGGTGGAGTGSGAGEGGAIFSDDLGSLTVTGSTFTGNVAGGDGGGGNVSGQGFGGAIATGNGGGLTLSDDTITQNTAGGADGVGGMSGVGQGGGVAVGNVTATLRSDTIDANTVGSASGSSGAGLTNDGNLAIVGTIVSGNAGADNCFSTGSVTASFSLEGPAGQMSCGFDLPSADPLLALLADNGGPTETQALSARSPAIGAVTSGPDCVGTDQRGAGRTSAHCDVGAYELAPPYVGTAQAISVGTTTAALYVPLSNPDVLAGTAAFQYGTSTAYGSSTPLVALPPIGGAPAADFAFLSGLTPGAVYHFRVVATNPDGTTFGPDQQFTTASPPVPPVPPPSNIFTFGRPKVGPRGAIALPVNAPDAGRFTAKATFTVITRRGHRRVKTTFTYGTASLRSTGRGTFKLVIGLKRRAARELKLLGSRQVTIAVTFTPTGAAAHLETKKVTVKRSRKGKYS